MTTVATETHWSLCVGLTDVRDLVDLTRARVANKPSWGPEKQPKRTHSRPSQEPPVASVIPPAISQSPPLRRASLTARILAVFEQTKDVQELAAIVGCTPKHARRVLLERDLVAPKQVRFSRRLVVQSTLDGTFIARFNSAAEASRMTGINRDTIRRICNQGKGRKYMWHYEERTHK